MNGRRSNSRKVHVSWHKATRSVWLNYGKGDIGDRAAQKFNNEQYRVRGQSVHCSVVKQSASQKRRGGIAYNPVAWTITLSGVPGNATTKDIEAAIKAGFDQPRRIELGPVSYHASDPEVSVMVRSHLEEHGRLESFYFAPITMGKRVKVAALFEEEVDARSACSLNNKRLPILGGGKLTVTLMQSTKIKVRTTVYLASMGRIEEVKKTWREQHLTYHVYKNTPPGFATFKVEGSSANDVAHARKALDEVFDGTVLKTGDNTSWTPALNSKGNVYQQLKAVEQELSVVIYKDRSKRELRYYGPVEKLQEVSARVTSILTKELCTSYEINLNASQFSWVIQGGFKTVKQPLGKNVIIFDVVAKTLTVSGTNQRHERALSFLNGGRCVNIPAVSSDTSLLGGDCPICFCEADNPFQTLCKHTYCLECFEGYCKSAASTSKSKFEVKCQGDEGTCSTISTFRQLKEWLPSSVFERVLKSSFEEYNVILRPFAMVPLPIADTSTGALPKQVRILQLTVVQTVSSRYAPPATHDMEATHVPNTKTLSPGVMRHFRS